MATIFQQNYTTGPKHDFTWVITGPNAIIDGFDAAFNEITGGHARAIGTIDLSAVPSSYWAPSGSLDTLTVIVDIDGSGPQTITLVDPTGIADLVTQVSALAGGTAFLEQGKYLLIQSDTVFGGSIAIGAGTANALLGFTGTETDIGTAPETIDIDTGAGPSTVTFIGPPNNTLAGAVIDINGVFPGLATAGSGGGIRLTDPGKLEVKSTTYPYANFEKIGLPIEVRDITTPPVTIQQMGLQAASSFGRTDLLSDEYSIPEGTNVLNFITLLAMADPIDAIRRPTPYIILQWSDGAGLIFYEAVEGFEEGGILAQGVAVQKGPELGGGPPGLKLARPIRVLPGATKMLVVLIGIEDRRPTYNYPQHAPMVQATVIPGSFNLVDVGRASGTL